jgi:hypothetical protein
VHWYSNPVFELRSTVRALNHTAIIIIIIIIIFISLIPCVILLFIVSFCLLIPSNL